MQGTEHKYVLSMFKRTEFQEKTTLRLILYNHLNLNIKQQSKQSYNKHKVIDHFKEYGQHKYEVPLEYNLRYHRK